MKNNNELRILEGLEKREEVVFDITDNDDKTFISEIDGIKYNLDLFKRAENRFLS